MQCLVLLPVYVVTTHVYSYICTYVKYTVNSYIFLYREKLLSDWLYWIQSLKDTLTKYYLPVAYLFVFSKEQTYKELIDAMDSLQKKLPSEFYPQQPN